MCKIDNYKRVVDQMYPKHLVCIDSKSGNCVMQSCSSSSGGSVGSVNNSYREEQSVKQRIVVCAANIYRIGNYTISLLVGARHFDSAMRKQLDTIDEEFTPEESTGWKQGFIDQYGVFMTREEAWLVAEAAGQIKYRVGGDMHNGVGKLFSENLY